MDRPPAVSRLLSFWSVVPGASRTLVVLGAISFVAVFAWRFAEPQFHFYVYDVLGWSSARFGLVIGGYSFLLVGAKAMLGGLSDRFGRRPVLLFGLVVHAAQYAALIATDALPWIALGIAGSGLGEGLFMPALNAYFLDVAPAQHRAQAIGFREAMFSLGGLAGPAIVVWAARFLQPVGVFWVAGALVLLSAAMVPLLSLRACRGRAPGASHSPAA